MQVPGYEVVELDRYDPEVARFIGDLVHAESPWKNDGEPQPVDMGLLREAVETENHVIIASRQKSTGLICSTEEIAAFPMMDAGKMSFMGFTATLPEHRNKGLYRTVWDYGLRWLVDKEVKTMIFNSNPAIPLRSTAREMYIRYGAVPVSLSPDPEDIDAGTDYFKLNVAHGVKVWHQLHGVGL